MLLWSSRAHPPASGKTPQRETWGIRLQFTNPDAAPSHTYFSIPSRLEYAEIAPDGKLLPDDVFRTWLRGEYGNQSLFSRQRDYLEEMAAPRHLNFDLIAFQRTFPKAIAFELEENVEKFIREFILEENPLDVNEVRAALRAYDDTRRRLEKQEDEAAFLRRICEQHERCEYARREEAILRHTARALRLLQAEERRARHATELKRLEDEHADDLRNLEAARSQAADVEKLLGEVRFEIQKDPEGGKLDQLDRQRREMEESVKALREAQKSARQRLDERHYRWVQWLKHGAALPLDGLREALVVDDVLLTRLRSGTDAERLEAMAKLAGRFNDLWISVRDLMRPVQDGIKTAQSRLQQLAEDLENLSKGRAPGSFPLFHAIRQKLGSRAEQLGRLIEVKPEAERWWPALELFLGRNRWAVVVDEGADYRAALDILSRTPPGREGESLLNPVETRQLRGGAREGSLFEKVEVAHPIARHYVEHLFGDVRCVETLEELETAEVGRAITPDGIFKQVPLRRRLKSAGSVELTLGREGLARMRAAKQKEQTEVRTEFNALERQFADVKSWLDGGGKGGLGDSTLPDRASELAQLPQLEGDLGRLRATIELLMTPEREARQKRLSELESEEKQILARVAVLTDRKSKFELTVAPALRDKFRAHSPKWAECFSAVADAASKAGQEAVAAEQGRNNERLLLATVRDERGNLRHPEYQGEFSPDDPGNELWSARLRVLEGVELEKSRQLAADRKAERERRLEDNVLNELNRRITDATNTVRLLDRYLSQPVGKFRYRISQRKDNAYAAIWSLLSSGLEPTDPLAAAIRDRGSAECQGGTDARRERCGQIRRSRTPASRLSQLPSI